MTLGLTAVGLSAGLLALLTLLFRTELARGERLFLSGVRTFLDKVVLWMSSKIGSFFSHIGAGSLRFIYHYLVHKMLSSFIRFLTRAQERLYALQHRNKRSAKVIRSSEDKTHLEAIADHKVETTLSEAEKRKRRSH